MSSQDIQLLRRPLPPKHTPSHCEIAESIPAQVQEEGTERRNEWSDHGNALPWNNGLPCSRLSFLLAETPIVPYKIINSFPSRPRRIIPKARILDVLRDDPRYTVQPPNFLLEFLKPTQSESEPVQTSQSQKKVVQYLSGCNYRKFVDHLLSELHDGQQREVASQILSCEQLPQLERRIPQRQIICELAAVIRVHQGHDKLLRTADVTQAVCPHTQYDKDPVVLSFQGSCRSHSPSLAPVSPSERAVVECLKKGGATLNLKAHFIDQLPDLSLLISTLCYLNLSFNDFSLFPVEVCELTKLEVLKLRDNPIEEIPAEIQKLINLKMLVVSFCKLTALPSQLYQLPSLQHLDVSHNLIGHLSNSISNLRSLRYLNVEGNQLAALPAGLLRLPLSQLKLDRSYTHSRLSKQDTHSQQVLHTDTHTHTHTHRLSICVCVCN
ncbi:leucine-rich repeat-containing protein 63 isoform X2 [Ictalurus furcatus]|uniref:leucine-rich repeat-containing protein 63 isoform X2 n=1 Tax=Ictalurus furcatus TaxID=66913 RepID=UPI00234FE547|nr:leucine-rich repeat-containing protein 63 isoform X2 [Ictalurus furcatus]